MHKADAGWVADTSHINRWPRRARNTLIVLFLAQNCTLGLYIAWSLNFAKLNWRVLYHPWTLSTKIMTVSNNVYSCWLNLLQNKPSCLDEFLLGNFDHALHTDSAPTRVSRSRVVHAFARVWCWFSYIVISGFPIRRRETDAALLSHALLGLPAHFSRAAYNLLTSISVGWCRLIWWSIR
jgi:hypothetical protein